MMNRWTSTLRLTVESATTRPGFRSAAKLLSRERSESCLVCALRKVRTCLWIFPFRVQFRRFALSDRRAQTTMATETVERRLEQLMGHFCEIMRQRKEKGLQSTPWKYLRRSKKKRHNVPDWHRALHMHVLERDFSIRAACVQHDCATCASMQRDAVTAAQSRFLATHVSVWGNSERKVKAGATQTETSLLKQYVAGECVDLLDDYDFPARTITDSMEIFEIWFSQRRTVIMELMRSVLNAQAKDRKWKGKESEGKGEREIGSEALAETEKNAIAPARNRTRDTVTLID